MSATFPPKPGAPKGTIKADLLVTHRHKPETRLVDITVTYTPTLPSTPAQTQLEGAARGGQGGGGYAHGHGTP